uniref:non-specific serine/threonine protein kinase n=1 Tax=Lactuca sativa TaxID=4236 RepID=A0A9R1WM88_LACSA|nr:hypothetical protein LSAT_V11C100018240 [Lactuca sativa]
MFVCVIALAECLSILFLHIPFLPLLFQFDKKKIMSYALNKISHLRIPYEDHIESATDDMDDENIISENDECVSYRGQLLWSGELIDIVAQEYDRHLSEGISKFEANALILSGLKHKNIVSFVGFCEDPYWVIIVTKYEVNKSLDMYLSDSRSLSWMKRLQICVGVAHGLSYLHYEEGRDYSVIHCNIKSSSILLDENWEPKITYFGNSIRTPVAQRHRLLHAKHSGTVGYMDAIYEKTKGVTHKVDVFSFGVVLFEVLFGWEASSPNEENESLVQSAKLHYEKGTLEDMISSDLREEMDDQSFNIFSETAYCCLKAQRAQRPNMDQIVKRLEKAVELQKKFENHEHSRDASEGTSMDRLKGKDFEHLKIKLSDLEFATEEFSEKFCIGSGGYGKVYKAKLQFDGKSYSKIEEKNEGEFPNKDKTVAIKRIFSRADKQGEDGFVAEIEMLSSCKNRNIVSLLGFCDEGPQQNLVYEYVSNGSLDDYLGSINNMTNLTWLQRIRICIDIAHGLEYLHSSTENKQKIIHRDIKSANILLDENWEAKIADFGLSKFHPLNHQASTLNSINVAGTEVYLDPEYLKTGKFKKATDVYSLGVVFFEILCGKVAYDPIYLEEDVKGLGPIARRRFQEGTLKEMRDPNLTEESDEIFFTQNRGLNEDSLATFSEIAYKCLAETQAERPTMEVVIEELKKALSFQENQTDNLKFSLEDIKLATENFSNCLGEEECWGLYKGEVLNANGSTMVVAKRLDNEDTDFIEHEFFTELKILHGYKHKNIIGLVGYCNEMGERIILYENTSKGSLDRYLKDINLTWKKRLEICIDVATGLDFLHGGDTAHELVVHRSITSFSILLSDDWKARISNLGLSLVTSVDNEVEFDISDSSCPVKYIDPLYRVKGTLTKESDIFSIGLVLFEILYGFSTSNNYSHDNELTSLVKDYYREGKLDELVFEGIKEQTVPQSLTAFQKIALQCLHDKREERPTAGEVLIQLKKALEFQEDYEMWEPKLPKDYKEIILMSKTPDVYSMSKKKDIYDMLLKGILVQQGNVWFSIGENGGRNEMLSARNFSYKNRWSRKRRYVPQSRFHKAAEMLDISNLNIQIKIKPQFLSPDVNYGVYLVFRFSGPTKSKFERMYVNLKYKKGSETLHAYFAIWREDDWMMIELCRFLNHKEDTDFEFLLESFQRCYCESRVKHEEIKELKETQEVLKSDLYVDQVQQNYDKGEKLFSLNDVNKQKHYILSAKEALYQSSHVKFFDPIPSTQSRFQNAIELQRQQVFRIKCKIESQRLSPDTEYTCYLVFKLSEKCHGLHCPVIVRDLLQQRQNKEKGILYFRSPSPCNVNDTDWVPVEREDGWREINVWKFNSSNKLRDDCISINLKLISYEGTMSGLIISSLEFRPM